MLQHIVTKSFLASTIRIFLLSLLFLQTAFADNSFQHGISIFGDLKYPKNFHHFDYVNPEAPKGGKIKYGVQGSFNSLNPFILKGISAAGIEMIFDSLMEGSGDEISSKYGLIAKSAKLAEDHKSITFKLRQNAFFHDGSSITADDVIFSFNTLISKAHPSYKMIYSDISKARWDNKYQVTFLFKHNKNRSLATTIATLPVFSKKFYTENEFDKTTLQSPLGSGPYRVKFVDSGKSITYERVKDYWAKDLPVNIGRYNFDEISYDYYRDSNILVEAFKAGSYDFRQENISRNWATAYDIDKVRNEEIIKSEIPHKIPTGMQAFVFNLRKDKFKNRHLRQAISYAFDFEWVREKIFYGSYDRTNSFFANSDFASSGKIAAQEKQILKDFVKDLPPEIFTEDFTIPKTDGSGYDRTNLLKARRILRKAGYMIRDGALFDPNNQHFEEIEFLIYSKSFQMVIAPMIKNLAKLGIKARIRMVDEHQYKNRLDNFDYDIVVNVFGQNLIPGNELFSFWHSSQKNIVGSGNLAGVDNQTVDYLIEKIINATDKKELTTLTRALDRVLLWNFYVIPQWHNRTYRILYQNKFAFPKKYPDYSINLDAWWHL